ncbi:hypothetical protein EYF80_029711 [Liparis tanakae]|uniref:Uncharacterized protein n=1 Tax=Liparis tanakae TaxID=230148 RepID=A0A4Z2H540_9TELE|nr:hypothetical protein EYF80_029711 [Liparis tanakae]
MDIAITQPVAPTGLVVEVCNPLYRVPKSGEPALNFFSVQHPDVLHMCISYSKCCITSIRACRFLSSRKC